MFSMGPRIAVAGILTASALVVAGCAGEAPSRETQTLDPNEEITLDFAYWGNDVRAEMYEKVIDAFEEEHPNITVRSSFLGFAEFWEKRQTEAAGGGLPDVLQFSDRYIRQYAQNGLLLDLEPYLGEQIQVDTLPDSLIETAQLDGETLAIPVSTNAWSLWTNPVLLDRVGVDDFDGGSWDDYNDWLSEFSDAATASGQQIWASNDYTAWLQNFELAQRAKGKDLFTEDGEPNFTRDELAEWWGSVEDLRGSVLIPQQKLEETLPLGGFDAALQGAELAWDNLGPGYLNNLGEQYPELNMQAPPTDDPGVKDLYQAPGMLLAADRKTDHPAAAAALIDFLTNAEITGEVFGLNRGVPASETALAGAELDGVEQQILDHQNSLADRYGDAPPVPVIGYGTIFETFRSLGQELNFGTITVDEAVDRFFTEMDVALQG